MAKRPNRTARAFSDRFVMNAKAGWYADAACPTLCLKVAPSGSRSWVQRITIAGRQTMLGLGPYPVVTLAEARDLAIDNRRAVRAGIDPRAAKRARRACPTVAEAVDAVIRLHRARWNGKEEGQWRGSLGDYVLPHIGYRRIDEVTVANCKRCVEGQWLDKHPTMKRVLRRMRVVFDWAIAEGYRVDNPAGPALAAALPKPCSPARHHPAMNYAEVGAFLRALDGVTAWWAAKECLRFTVLTGVRSGEARGAVWDEIDLDARVWVLPRGRMKRGLAHRVPLSDAAAAVLLRARQAGEGQGLVFPAQRSRGPMTDVAVAKPLKALRPDCTVHGMRSAFRSWAEERSGASERAMEFALGHVEGNATVAAYQRSDLLEARRRLMDDWAHFLSK